MKIKSLRLLLLSTAAVLLVACGGSVEPTPTPWTEMFIHPRSDHPKISADGRFVVFSYGATRLKYGTNDQQGIYVHDLQTKESERVSIGMRGQRPNDASWGAINISADGRFVVFLSDASNLVPRDINLATDIFVYDRAAGETALVPGGEGTSTVSISANGRYVAYTSGFDLDADNSTSNFSVYVYDLLTDDVVLASILPDGKRHEGTSGFSTISADGRFVAYSSYYLDLDADNSTASFLQDQIFVRDLQRRETILVSITQEGKPSNGYNALSSISADGRFVAFESYATNLLPIEQTSLRQIFVRDIQRGKTVLVSIAPDGSAGEPYGSYEPHISADGRFVAFESGADNLIIGHHSNKWSDVYVRDLEKNKTILVSVAHDGGVANGNSFTPSISADGRFIAFASNASNLVPDDTNEATNIFVYDALTNETVLIPIPQPTTGSVLKANGSFS